METIGPTGMTGMFGTPVSEPLPDILTFNDILSDHTMLVKKEEDDRLLLESIGTTHVQTLKPAFIDWMMKGCPPAYPILTLNITPPAKCSDGVVRNLTEYIKFCSGKSIVQHVELLQAKLPDIRVSFANFGGGVTIVVFKA